jgi:diguanylate cyclase (GGDEF)-like protein
MGEWQEPRTEQVWEQFHAVDTSISALVLQLLRALAGLTTAYLVARIITERWLDLGSSFSDLLLATAIHVTLSGLALFLTSARPIRRDLMAQRELLRASEAEMLARVEQQAFLRDVQDALDMGETEGDALEVTSKALRDAAPGPAELLVADASRAHLRRAATAPGREPPCCAVETPWGCPAVRQGRTLRFERSDDLSACPRLTGRGGDVVSAVCVPITILGTPTAVIHATAPVEAGAWTQESIDRLEGVAAQVGTRLGVLRAMAKSQLQAETDPLTGLLNRRAMEERVRHLRDASTPFALAMADLDHFKRLNDSYGHDTGDRALRSFARVLREAVRDADVVARHGGEEFVIVLPGVDALTAAPILHRIRDKLADAVGTALIPAFTVSIGVADSSWSTDVTDVLRAADHALLTAKAQGRDRLVIADPPAAGSTTPPVPLPPVDPDAVDPDSVGPLA